MFALFLFTFQQEVHCCILKYINFLLSSPFWPFEYLKLLKKSKEYIKPLKPMLRCVPALVPGVPPPRCVLLHPAQRGQPLQLAQQLRQVRELVLVTRRPCSCCRGTMLPLSRYDDVRTEERMNLEDCYQHCKVTITNSVPITSLKPF